MSAAPKYRRYPEAIKIQIAKSQNPHLFPELSIPRTTARQKSPTLTNFSSLRYRKVENRFTEKNRPVLLNLPGRRAHNPKVEGTSWYRIPHRSQASSRKRAFKSEDLPRSGILCAIARFRP
jgi:hypothetical protein